MPINRGRNEESITEALKKMAENFVKGAGEFIRPKNFSPIALQGKSEQPEQRTQLETTVFPSVQKKSVNNIPIGRPVQQIDNSINPLEQDRTRLPAMKSSGQEKTPEPGIGDKLLGMLSGLVPSRDTFGRFLHGMGGGTDYEWQNSQHELDRRSPNSEKSKMARQVLASIDPEYAKDPQFVNKSYNDIHPLFSEILSNKGMTQREELSQKNLENQRLLQEMRNAARLQSKGRSSSGGGGSVAGIRDVQKFGTDLEKIQGARAPIAEALNTIPDLNNASFNPKTGRFENAQGKEINVPGISNMLGSMVSPVLQGGERQKLEGALSRAEIPYVHEYFGAALTVQEQAKAYEAMQRLKSNNIHERLNAMMDLKGIYDEAIGRLGGKYGSNVVTQYNKNIEESRPEINQLIKNISGGQESGRPGVRPQQTSQPQKEEIITIKIDKGNGKPADFNIPASKLNDAMSNFPKGWKIVK